MPPTANPAACLPRQDYFLSCDWGTTAFRLRLVQARTLRIIAATRQGAGILATHQAWLDSGGRRSDRRPTFRAVLARAIASLEARAGVCLDGVPLVISGMASASIGLCTLPYRHLPFALAAASLGVRLLSPVARFSHPVLLISGAATGDDVMRGEETQLIGALADRSPGKSTQVVILPGTHSKHVTIQQGRVESFETHMTGEFFDLLTRQSILRHSVAGIPRIVSKRDRAAFARGVSIGAARNLLHACFTVRSRHLLARTTSRANSLHLSGLLIGAELRGLVARPPAAVALVCGPTLHPFYTLALKTLLPLVPRTMINADRALLLGQRAVAAHVRLLPCFRPN